ncbi:MAG: fibronectin type III domain-containing protein, partial [Bacteroidales bacterium]|nr:fibronectin type III domain-containing protein [Bacteroidales bacterium]
MKNVVRYYLFIALLMTPLVAGAQDTLYWCDFDQPGDTSGWRFTREYQSHWWIIGSDSNMSSRMLFVTYNGVDNEYSSDEPSSVSFAYRRIVLQRGAYRFSYDWRCNGRRDGDTAYDYMRVLLVPGMAAPIGGWVPDGMGTMSDAVLPEGYVPLDGNSPLCASPVWVSHSSDCFVEDSGVYTLVFMWYSTVGQWNSPAAVDNLAVTSPVCPQAGHLFVSPLAPTEFTMHWSDFSEGNTSHWQVELCTASQTVGQGTSQTVQDTMADFTNLTPNTDYWVYVSPLCDSDTVVPVVMHVHTPCAGLDSLPYTQNFETAAVGRLPQCWRVLRNDGNATVRSDGVGNALQWRIAHSGYCCVVLPSVDGNALTSGNLQLSFRCKEQSGYVRFSHEFEVGLLSNPDDVGSFVPIGRVMVNSEQWERCVVEFDGYSGESIAILDRGNDLIEGYVWFDDFEIGEASACQPVEHLTVGGTSAAGTMVGWELPRGTLHEPSGYEVRVEPVDTLVSNPLEPGAASLLFRSTEPRCIVSGLQPYTTYRAWVRAQCADSVYGEWRHVGFVTLPLPCEVGDTTASDTASVGTDINRISGVPVSNMYVNSLCQSIYTADELHAAGVGVGVITGMDYGFTNNPRDMLVSIYVSTTGDSLYATADDMVAVSDGVLVYGPALHAAGTSGTVHYEFDRLFSWNGLDNLVVTIIINNAAGNMQSASFFGYSTQTVGNRTVRSYMNDEPFTAANALTGVAVLSDYRPSVTFHTMVCSVSSTCAPPAVTAQGVGEDYAMVVWAPGYRESEWSVFYRQTGGSEWTLAGSHVDTNRYLLPLLDANTGYDVRIVPYCGGDSIYGEAHFTTLCASVYELPFSEDFEDFEASSSNVEDFEACWYRGLPMPGYTNFCIPFVESGGGNTGTYYLEIPHMSGIRWPFYIATPAMAMDVSELQV